MTTQKAVALTKVASPLTAIEVAIPTPKGNEILIKLTACAIAPFEQKLRDLGLFNISARLPAILSYDLVGTVHAHSSDLPTELKHKYPVGTHVFAQPSNLFNPFSGGFQEHTLIDARYAAIVPSSLGDADLAAALFPVNGLTSFASLFSVEGGEGQKTRGLGIPIRESMFPTTSTSSVYAETAGKAKGNKDLTLLIIGGSSRCGKLGIQFARLAGVGQILTTASTTPENVEELKALGATHVFDRKLSEDELLKQIREVVGDELTLVYDTIHTGTFSLAIRCLSDAKAGKLCTLLHGSIPEEALAEKKGGVERWQMFGSHGPHPVLAEIFWGRIGGWIEEGLNGGTYEVLEGGLDDVNGINEALDGYRDGGVKRFHLRIS